MLRIKRASLVTLIALLLVLLPANCPIHPISGDHPTPNRFPARGHRPGPWIDLLCRIPGGMEPFCAAIY